MSYNEYGDAISYMLAPVADQASQRMFADHSIAVGQVTAVYAVDDKDNYNSNDKLKQVRYDVEVLGPNGESELIPRCVAMGPAWAGGANDSLEFTYEDPAPGNQPNRSLRKGHYVVVAFLAGKRESGVILGSLGHRSSVAARRRPKKADGAVLVGELRGLSFSVNKDGELKVTFNGPRDASGNTTSDKGPTSVTLDKTGSVVVETNNQQKIVIDRDAQEVTVTCGPTSCVMKGKSDLIQVKADRVEVGDANLEPMVTGYKWKKIMEDLIDEIMRIIHPTGVGPSGVPYNNPKFLALRKRLKEALSDHHWVEK